jgi:hypothetical protein
VIQIPFTNILLAEESHISTYNIESNKNRM